MIVMELEPRPGLHDRNRELAAGEEAGFLAVDRDEVRFGQALEQPLVLQRLNDGAEAGLVVEDEEVQEVAEHQAALVSVSKSGAGTSRRGDVRPGPVWSC